MSMQRKPAVEKITFSGSTTGVTRTGVPLDVGQYAFAGIHVSSGLNNRTINFVDNGEWGAETVLSKFVTTGFNAFSQDDLLKLAPSMQLSFTLDNAATGNLYLKLKS